MLYEECKRKSVFKSRTIDLNESTNSLFKIPAKSDSIMSDEVSFSHLRVPSIQHHYSDINI